MTARIPSLLLMFTFMSSHMLFAQVFIPDSPRKADPKTTLWKPSGSMPDSSTINPLPRRFMDMHTAPFNPDSDSETRKKAFENAAIDPGILHVPEQTGTPAGLVIIPPDDVDPKMVFDPGPRRQENRSVQTVRPKRLEKRKK